MQHLVTIGTGATGGTGPSPSDEERAVGVKDGLLALLASGPRHGYALKLGFEQATGGTWDLNVGQVYTALQRLEADGYVAFDGEEEGRKRFRLTDTGAARVTTWLTDEPVAHSLAARDELSMKVLLARSTRTAPPVEVVAAQRVATMSVLQAHTATKARAGPDAPLEQLVHLDRLILHCRAELDWLDLVEQRLEDHDRAANEDHGRAAVTTHGGATT
jgi:DNA-binding PadR family transcriptional regulator